MHSCYGCNEGFLAGQKGTQNMPCSASTAGGSN